MRSHWLRLAACRALFFKQPIRMLRLLLVARVHILFRIRRARVLPLVFEKRNPAFGDKLGDLNTKVSHDEFSNDWFPWFPPPTCGLLAFLACGTVAANRFLHGQFECKTLQLSTAAAVWLLLSPATRIIIPSTIFHHTLHVCNFVFAMSSILASGDER